MLRSWLRSAVIGVIGLGIASAGCARGRGQPIAFNHRLHADNNVPCGVCHPTAAAGEGASLPRVADCRRCHEDVLYESPGEARIRLAAESGREIRWVPVTALHAHVYFSHRRHVTLGKVPCRACHGNVELRTKPFQASVGPFSRYPGMKACTQCHEMSHSRFAGIDCIDCHR